MMDRQQGLAGTHYHGGEYQHDGDPVARESLNEGDVEYGRKDLNILEADQGREEELTNRACCREANFSKSLAWVFFGAFL